MIYAKFKFFSKLNESAQLACRETTVTLMGKQVFGLKFGDDIVLISHDNREQQISANRAGDFFRTRSLAVNYEKCKILAAVGHGSRVLFEIRIDGILIKQVTEFCYLGLFLNERFDLSKTAKAQGNKVVSSYYRLCSRLKTLPSSVPFSVVE